MTSEFTGRPSLTAANERAATALDRYYAAKRAHEKRERVNWLGTLAITFTTDELQLICDSFSIDETLTLRRLGVLAPDEGFDGRRPARKRAKPRVAAKRGRSR